MDIQERIKYDTEDLKSYFLKLFIVMDTPEVFSDSNHFKQYVKSDMVCNIYGCLDFWLSQTCEHKHSAFALQLSYKDIKAKNDLAVYHKYLEKIVGIDMSKCIDDYNNLQDLRMVRNCIIHAGSHTEKVELNKIKGVNVSGTLVTVTKDYVFDTLVNAKNYLLFVNKP
ncbi:hypothetical protein [Methylotenera sp.]|uniref:hypothetical protein n=1 Tax=Methylotenera sp. TaxID=2051956 RepID=UPI0024884B36|nr:hypothetical protein [Methylotenera sp.]MDI1299499.1 hypothetical protein [Methylotenera sp.]